MKIACLSCQAPYDIDEKKVPEGGLTFTCPRCGYAFLLVGEAPAEEEEFVIEHEPHRRR